MKHHFLVSMIGFIIFRFPLLHAGDARFQVKHDHLVGSCRGELVFEETALQYISSHKTDERLWKYEDIQQLGLLGPRKIAILTYEDRRAQFGKDRNFNFELTEGEISDSLWRSLQSHLTKPLMSSLIPPGIEARFRLPVKHRHALGGCQGELDIADQYVIYRTSNPSDSRIWRYEDISSMGSTGPFQLRLSIMERVHGEYGGEKNFIFDLKQRLNDEVYDFIWWKINGRHIGLKERLF